MFGFVDYFMLFLSVSMVLHGSPLICSFMQELRILAYQEEDVHAGMHQSSGHITTRATGASGFLQRTSLSCMIVISAYDC